MSKSSLGARSPKAKRNKELRLYSLMTTPSTPYLVTSPQPAKVLSTPSRTSVIKTAYFEFPGDGNISHDLLRCFLSPPNPRRSRDSVHTSTASTLGASTASVPPKRQRIWLLSNHDRQGLFI